MAGPGVSTRWQDRLSEYCHGLQWSPPTWQMASDRRGGRTAWSSAVQVQGRTFQARYFYDAQHANNAKEDAAEVALIQLQAIDPSTCQSSSSSGRVA